MLGAACITQKGEKIQVSPVISELANVSGFLVGVAAILDWPAVVL